MATANDGRVFAKEENGMPIFATTEALFNGYYNQQMKKSAGSMGYSTTGAVNPIYGQFVSAVVFACDSVFTALGVKPWDRTGVRVQTSLAQKGGIGTNRGGAIPTSVKPDLAMVREPYKELPFAFNYDIGLTQLENKDDTITWQNYVELQGRTYSDAIDTDLLTPTEEATKTRSGEEIQIEKLSRIVASSIENGAIYDTLGKGAVTLTADNITPYGGSISSDLSAYRGRGVSAFDAYVDNAKTTLDLEDLNKMWSGCAPYWANSATPQNKMWAMSFEAQRRIAGLLSATQRFMETTFTTRDINGVSTVPGRDAGFVTKAYNDIPIIADGNFNVNTTTQLIPNTPSVGDIYLIDLDHIWYKALRPVDFRTTDQYQIYDQLTNKAVYFMEGEVCTDSWRGSAKRTQAL